jgi:hypothetical protein
VPESSPTSLAETEGRRQRLHDVRLSAATIHKILTRHEVNVLPARKRLEAETLRPSDARIRHIGSTICCRGT